MAPVRPSRAVVRPRDSHTGLFVGARARPPIEGGRARGAQPAAAGGRWAATPNPPCPRCRPLPARARWHRPDGAPKKAGVAVPRGCRPARPAPVAEAVCFA